MPARISERISYAGSVRSRDQNIAPKMRMSGQTWYASDRSVYASFLDMRIRDLNMVSSALGPTDFNGIQAIRQ